MVRGGGGFGGGRGGSFGGGGFRGGGFRGGSGGFRGGGGFNRSSRPFGRTGAHRSVSRPPSGRNYYGHRRSHYYGGWYYRPWYRRHYWFWGYPYRPWYYSPVYVGGGFILFILLLLLIIPLIGLFTIPYPSNNGGIVTYQDTQTLYYNEYWYEKEPLKAGNQIQYQVSAQSPITFLIADKSLPEFSKLPNKVQNTVTDTFTVQRNHDFQYFQFFLQQGDQVSYDFTSNNNIEFFISDGEELQKWNNWENSVSYNYYIGTGSNNGSFTAPHIQDWYFVWYNPAGSFDVEINADMTYFVSQYDFSEAEVNITNTNFVAEDTVTVDSDGSWYFIIYFDPFDNPNSQVDISFTVKYFTNITDNERWMGASPVLIFIIIVLIIVLIVALYQRRQAKQNEKKEKNETSPPPPPTTTSESTSSLTQGSVTDYSGERDLKSQQCHNCKTIFLTDDKFCTNCGTKLVGRDYGVAKETIPAHAKHCTICGYKMDPDSMFCSNCGSQRKK